MFKGLHFKPCKHCTNTMSTKGQILSTTTREKISLSKRKITKDHLISAAITYIDSIIDNEGKFSDIPSIVGYCLAASVSRSRLYELAAEWSEVADIVEYIEMQQEKLAISEGFRGKASIFSMFILKSRHNYHDSPQQLTQNNTFNVSPELLADALKLMRENK